MNPLLRRLFGFDYADEYPLTKPARKNLTFFYWDAIFAQISEASSSSYVTLFLVALKASNTQIGFLSTLTQVLTALAPLPSAAFAERTRRPRPTVLAPAILAHIGWFVLASLPVIVLGPPAVPIAIGLFGFRALAFAWIGPPWTALVGQLVPVRVRASYFATRNFGSGVATIIGTLLAGQVITALGFPRGYMLIFGLSGIAGLCAVYMFSRIQFASATEHSHAADDSGERARAPIGFRGLLRAHPMFTRLLVCNGVLALAVGIGGPFIGVYQVRVLHFEAGLVGLVVSGELIANIIMQRIYGRFVIPRFGEFRVMRALRPLTAFVPFAWLFATSPIAGLLVQMSAGAIWSGHELSYFNNLLTATPERGRARMIALHTVVISLCAAVGPAIGGALVDSIGFKPLFVTSALLRLSAGILLWVLIKELKST